MTLDKPKFFNRIWRIYKLGGLRLVIAKMADKVFHTCHGKAYLQKRLKEADPSEYPDLLKSMWMLHSNSILNLENPSSFNEKIQWMKIHDVTPLKKKLSDKYLVREWVEEKIGQQHLIPLLGVWDRFEDIDFESLPDRFVLKCNHGSGMNIIVNDKALFDKESARKQINKWLNTDYAFQNGLELQYDGIPRKIMAEEYIEQENGQLYDYKVHVFNGRAEIIQVIGDRDFTNHKGKEAFFNTNWEPIEVASHTYDSYERLPEKPKNLQPLVSLANTLGEDFRYVRVDLYDINGVILFGEMTFTPASGYGKWGEKGTIFSKLMD